MGKLKSFFGKVKQSIKANKEKLPLLFAGVPVRFAVAESTVATDVDSFISEIKGALSDFTTTNLAKILVAALGITAVLAIAWFGYRFIVRKTSGAMKKGKL